MQLVRRGTPIAAGVWFLSWFALYLEIFRWRHLTLARIASVRWPGGGASQPGAFVRAVVVTSVVAPVAFLALAAAQRTPSSLSGQFSPTGGTSRGAEALVAFGIMLGVLGTLNQILRQPPLVVDLTLQRGNGGFIVFGVLLLTAGVVMRFRESQRHGSR